MSAPATLFAQVFTDLRPTGFYNVAGVASTPGGPMVVGVGGNDVIVTSRWTPTTGTVAIADLHTEPYPFQPEDISHDGQVIVGRGAGVHEPFRPSAYRWTQETGLQELTSNIRDSTFVVRTRVSGDGTTVAGFGASAAFRWTQETGTVFIGAKLNDIDVISRENPLFMPNALSRNGSVLVGTNTVDPFQLGEASKWTAETGLVGLGYLFGGYDGETSVATGINGSGSVIVGTGFADEFYSEAFRWTETGGMMSLGILPGGSSSVAFGISDDGGRIFGGTIFADNPFVTDPFVWTAQNGLRRLVDMLIERGAGDELLGWQLRDVTAFSADGRYVVGRGIGPDGGQAYWLADLGMSPVPEPSTLGLFAVTGLLVCIALRRRAQARRIGVTGS